MTKKQNDPKALFMIIPWGILIILFTALMIYSYLFNNRPPSKFEYQLFGFASGVLFTITGGIGIYFRNMGMFIKGKSAIVLGMFFIFLGLINTICYWSTIFG